jgi:hypothetical protein
MYCSHGLPYETKCPMCTKEAFVRERRRAEEEKAPYPLNGRHRLLFRRERATSVSAVNVRSVAAAGDFVSASYSNACFSYGPLRIRHK